MEWKQLAEFLFSRAMEHDSAKLLFRLACEYLISLQVIRPGVISVLERLATARDRARIETWSRVAHLLSAQHRAELDELLVVDPLVGRSRLAWLGLGPTQASPAAVKAELAKLSYLPYLRAPDAHTLDLSSLPAERRPVPGRGGSPVDSAGVVAAGRAAPVSDPVDFGGAVGG